MDIRAWRGLAFAVTILLGLTNALHAQSEDVGVLNNKVDELYRIGAYAEALPLAQHTLELAEAQHAPVPVLGAALDNLALVYKVLGRYAEAEPLYKRALDLHRQMPTDPDLPAAMNNLAMLYDAQHRFAEAESLLNKAIDKWEKFLGPDDPAVATGCNNLGLLYYHEGNYARALPLLERARTIREKALGPDDPAVASTLNNLALVYEQQGDFAQAQTTYERALGIVLSKLGPDHPTVARIRENLGGLYKSRGRRGDADETKHALDRAEVELARALAIKEKVFGTDSPNLTSTLAELGDLYRLRGKCGESENAFARARGLGGPMYKEVSVIFATDRMRDAAAATLAFGSERSNALSFGIVAVPISGPAPPSSGRQSATSKGNVRIASDMEGADRLPQRCATAVDDLHQLFNDPARARPKQALLFVHGYNVSFENAVLRAAQIAYDTSFDGNVFVFSWPSHARTLDYFTDSRTVNVAVGDLKRFMETAVAVAKPTKVHIIAHSMGNMVLLRALELGGKDSNVSPLIGQVITASPDVDPEYYRLVVGMFARPEGNFTLYAAQVDWALWLSSWIWGSRVGFINHVPFVTPGVDTIDISKGGSSVWQPFNWNHDIYVQSPVITGDMRRIIAQGSRPPDKRTAEFKPETSSAGPYWEFQP
jgi:esterase/lipase superfamily enzyme/Flp pilus assembly protein TadD